MTKLCGGRPCGLYEDEDFARRALVNRKDRLRRFRELDAPQPFIDKELELIAKAEEACAYWDRIALN